jgi:hypothetical protein
MWTIAGPQLDRWPAQRCRRDVRLPEAYLHRYRDCRYSNLAQLESTTPRTARDRWAGGKRCGISDLPRRRPRKPQGET